MQVADGKTINVDDAVKIGTDQMLGYAKTWPWGFHDTLRKIVIGISNTAKQKVTTDASQSGCNSALCNCTNSALSCTDFCRCRGDVGSTVCFFR